MIIVERDESRAEEWQDPLVEIGRTQLEAEVKRLDTLTSAAQTDAAVAYQLCDALCEASRDLLFRLYRVSVSELRTLIDAFKTASAAVESAREKANFSAQQKKDVGGYVKHINARINMLTSHLQKVNSEA